MGEGLACGCAVGEGLVLEGGGGVDVDGVFAEFAGGFDAFPGGVDGSADDVEVEGGWD